MTRYDNRVIALAICLSGLAGYVDALGFLKLNGFFVSFMSGNSTRLAVGLARGAPDAAMAAGLIAVFVAGVIFGSLTGHFAGVHRRAAVLGMVAVLLALAASLNALGAPRGAVVAMGLAMGAENAVFEEDGEVRIGLTYMTGTLVKVGQRLAAALRGGSPFAWTPYLGLWAGLVTGGITGALSYAYVGLSGLWLAAAVAAALAVAASALS
jgi:uncharacterized membrane protein YoaK (UPF0700 family)